MTSNQPFLLSGQSMYLYYAIFKAFICGGDILSNTTPCLV
ncbi:hypothetical protein OROGR_004062 [Orobanche gracilis]